MTDPRAVALALYRFALEQGLSDVQCGVDNVSIDLSLIGGEADHRLIITDPSAEPQEVFRGPPSWIAPPAGRRRPPSDPGAPLGFDPSFQAGTTGGDDLEAARSVEPPSVDDPLRDLREGDADEPEVEVGAVEVVGDDEAEALDEDAPPAPTAPLPRSAEAAIEAEGRGDYDQKKDAPLKPPGPGIGVQRGLQKQPDCHARCVVGDLEVIHAAECPHGGLL